jgi:predicted nucleic acid-binding protein
MIYLDSSVVLARILKENRRPSDAFWDGQMVSSRLLEYEVWRRVHARGIAASQGEFVQEILNRVAFVELTPTVLERAREPFPAGIRTLDALHLASADYLRRLRQPVRIATYDKRMLAAAKSLDIPAFEPD